MSKGHENLVKPRSTDEAREWGRNGGIASGESRRRKKSVAEIVGQVLNERITDRFILADITEHSIPVPEKPTYKDYLIGSVVMKTIERGKVDDLIKIMEILGEKPMQDDNDLLQNSSVIIAEIDSVNQR